MNSVLSCSMAVWSLFWDNITKEKRKHQEQGFVIRMWNWWGIGNSQLFYFCCSQQLQLLEPLQLRSCLGNKNKRSKDQKEEVTAKWRKSMHNCSYHQTPAAVCAMCNIQLCIPSAQSGDLQALCFGVFYVQEISRQQTNKQK